jgi:hypothetical protein
MTEPTSEAVTAEHTLELRKTTGGTATYKGKEIALPAWDVVLDGEVIGTVRKAMITRERRVPGRRIASARWTSPGWRYQRAGDTGRAIECPTRTDGVERLIRLAIPVHLGWREAQVLADSVRAVR